MPNQDNIREKLAQSAPTLWRELSEKAAEWTADVSERLARKRVGGYPKTFNDPIWGDIVLFPWETLLLDSKLLQRLRGVRQLGMAHLVYPGAGYDRLEHSRGVVEASERMIRSLERNAEFRRKYGKDRDELVPKVSDHDRVSIRLAALLHDIGHGAFSHASEALIKSRLESEFDAAMLVLRSHFEGVTSIAPGEVVACVLLLTEALKRIFESPNLGATERGGELALSVVARVLGSRSNLDAGYLSGVVSGPLDADKLDYMARDSHHAGLPIGLDLHRLISKLEVVTVTPDTTSNKEMIARARASTNLRFHEIGISLSGLGAYEQMIIGRVILYDRLYYHHKVRAAEAMVRRLIRLVEEHRQQAFTLGELFFDYPDDTVVLILGGKLAKPGLIINEPRASDLSSAIVARDVYYRAFAFAPRFILGLKGLPDGERRDARAILWGTVLSELSTLEGCDRVANEIFDVARVLLEKIPRLKRIDRLIRPEDVVVDLPVFKAPVRGGDILTRTEDGYVAPPHLFFDPERWSQAYEHQKQCGFVFAPCEFVHPVAIASRIVFYRRYQLMMDGSADRASKTAGVVTFLDFKEAADHQICDSELMSTFNESSVRLVQFRETEIQEYIPDKIRTEDPSLAKRMAESLLDAIPVGVSPSLHNSVLRGISHLFTFLVSLSENGDFVGVESIMERDLQRRLRGHLSAREAKVVEGNELAGGEVDLILDENLVIENKVLRTATSSPLTDGRKFGWQARRYAFALNQRVAIEVVAYRPRDENAILPISQSVCISTLQGDDSSFALIRFVTPWGISVPSRARASGAL